MLTVKQIRTNLTGLRKAGKVLLALAALLLLASVALAQSSDGYSLFWWTVDNGGATFANGGNYSLGGTTGQPDAGVLSGGTYTLGGGFWVGLEGAAPPVEYDIYLPLVMRNLL